MEESSIQICILCLSLMEDANFEVLEDLRANMLRTVLPIFNLNNFVNRIICCNCVSILQELYNFKMACVNSENHLKTLINSSEPLKVNLEDIKELVEDVETQKGQKKCRLCLNVVIDDCANMNDKIEGITVQNVLKKCIPELDLDLTNNPLVCQACLVLLKKQLTFVQHWSILEEKINLYRKVSCKGSPDKIDLYNVMHFFEKTDIDNVPEKNLTSLEEEDETNPRSTAECIELDCDIRENQKLDISESTVNIEDDNDENEESNREEEEINLPQEERQNMDITEQNSLEPTDVNSVNIFVCPKCSYSTECESSINLHMQQTHKGLLENSIFRCNLCQFETNLEQILRSHMFTHKHRPKCEICDISFVRKSLFKKHMLLLHKINTDSVYKCQGCSYSTDKHRNLMAHERTNHVLRHNNSSEVCTIHKCDKSNCSFRRHEHKCDKCEYSTMIRSRLRKHNKIHISKNRKHQCDKCEFSTNFRGSLRQHDERKHKNI